MDNDMNFWDQQFAQPGYKYGVQANRFLRQQAHRLKPDSDVLLPGDGEGRNSVWLAEQGHYSIALDNSATGLAKAVQLAQARGVGINTVHADLEHWMPQADSADALVLTFVHLPVAWRAVAHQRLASTLRPGGWLILEAFHPQQLQHQSGGPKAPAMLYSLDLIRADFSQTPGVCLQEALAWEGEAVLDEGPGHQGLAHLTRFVAQRI